MAVEPSSTHSTAQPRPAPSPSWLHARALWAGLSIITMWLAVLFVGIFGADFISNSGSSFTKIPVVVFLLPFVLAATIAIGRRAFTSPPDEREPASDAETQSRSEAAMEPSPLRAKPA